MKKIILSILFVIGLFSSPAQAIDYYTAQKVGSALYYCERQVDDYYSSRSKIKDICITFVADKYNESEGTVEDIHECLQSHSDNYCATEAAKPWYKKLWS